ncbi:MAG: hypothetical protein PHI34_05640 [Acidobacteriota bacterium]|nr:hypothetical protein [Acidobacteriota bacterium]
MRSIRFENRIGIRGRRQLCYLYHWEPDEKLSKSSRFILNDWWPPTSVSRT